MPALTPLGAAGELAASRHGVLTRRQAATVGLSPHRITDLIARGALTEPVAGVLVITSFPPTWQQGLSVAAHWSNCIGVIGFRAAAALRPMDGYRPGPVELLLPSPRKPRLLSAVHHVGPLDPRDVTEVDGIRCTTIERTLCDLGSIDPETRVAEAFEWAWRNGLDLAHFQRTIDRLHRPGQHGTKVAQRLLVAARVKARPTESALEVRLEVILDDIEGLVRQHEIRTPGGGFVARVDFAVPSVRVAIEAHSRQFHSGDAAEERDGRRHQRIIAQGWTVRYVTHDDMKDPIKVRASIQRLIRDRSPRETQPRRT